MKQYYITTNNIPTDSDEDAYIAPDDPLNELKVIQYLAGLNAEGRLQEYRAHNNAINKGSNISTTAAEKVALMKANDIKPGSQEYIKLWFSRPFLTGEEPVGK
jgi:hypothetical protein